MNIDRHHFRYFVEQWLEKSRNASHGDHTPFVDEFIHAYIAFNAAYTTAAYLYDGPRQVIRTWDYLIGGPRKPRRPKRFVSEQARATRLVIHLVGKKLLEEFLQTIVTEVHAACRQIEDGDIYVIEREDGMPDIAANTELATDIRRGNVESFLTLIYLLRCNLFHGAKHLSDVQRVQLRAATSYLHLVVPRMVDLIERQIAIEANA